MRRPAGGQAAPLQRRDDERALWRPTPLAALELESIPSELHFVRDHFPAPSIEPATWSLELTGDRQTLTLDLDQVRLLPQRRLSVVLECAGHRRAEFDPLPTGVPWACGAVAEARWTGTRLGPLLRRVGIPEWATEVVLEGSDCGPVVGFEGIHRFARSLPVDKALHHDVILAYEMNGEPIPVDRGGPVRAIVPGWYATDSVKWLDRIWFTSEPFGGVFQAHDYRLKSSGEPGPGRRMTTVPVHALITAPQAGEAIQLHGLTGVRGVAWGGTGGVARVQVRVDAGPWLEARLAPPRGPYARSTWELECHLASGMHEISCRAIDMAGRTQPDHPPANERGYANNAIHRVRMRRV
ncbi:MAG: sulfite oxidase [Solirubrobacteraceae bacterium]